MKRNHNLVVLDDNFALVRVNRTMEIVNEEAPD